MSSATLTPDLVKLRDLAAGIATTVLARECERIDREAAWPVKGMRALADAGLTGLHIPQRLGGLAQGLLALAVVSEELARHCSSTAMCFGMHSVAAKVLAAKSTAAQDEKFLRPIAEGRHISSLALSEPGTGTYFFLPRTTLRREGDAYVLEGEKSFVTSGGRADSYVVSAVPAGQELDPGAFSCLAVEADSAGLQWQQPWDGYGMRGNSSCNVQLNGVRAAKENLLGAEGDEIWYVFEVVAPYFIIAMSSVYLGIAQAALDDAISHLKNRRHAHTDETLSEQPVLSHELANCWIELEATRQLVYHAAREADAGAAGAPLALFAAKAKVAEVVNAVTDTTLILTGGRGYAANGKITRLHRDARAANVMSPTTHLLKAWLGRSLLDMPLL